MGRWALVAVVAVLSVGLLGACGAVAADADEGDGGTFAPDRSPGELPVTAQEDGLELPTQQEFERTQFRVLILPDGDAVWTFRYEKPIEDDEERSAFRTYAERFRDSETQLFRLFRNQSAALTEAAAAETGREMAATEYDRDADVEQQATGELGYVELSFRWTNFGRVEDGEVRVGDVFEGGLLLDAGQSFVYEAGEGVHFVDVAPEGATSQSELAESTTVTWQGEQAFADRHPRATLAIEGGAGPSEDAGGEMLWMLGGGALVLVVAVAAAFVRRRDVPGLPGRSTGDDAGSAGATDARPAPPEPPEVPAVEDDERVLELLEGSEGRMKQSDIVERTEWSKSKVSMLLSEMEEEGQISKIQVGRENIIALEGHEPEAAGSPFDESE